MAEANIDTSRPEHKDEDYTGAVCLLVKSMRGYKHARIEVLIDVDDLQGAAEYDWRIHIVGKPHKRKFETIVCFQRVDGSPVAINSLHRHIMKPAKGMEVDHRFHCRRDNRRAKLRVCTPTQNAMNRRRSQGSKHSKFKGVYKDKWRKSAWYAKITVDGKVKALGEFRTELQAAYAYNQAAMRHYGEFAYLNPIPDGYDPLEDWNKRPGRRADYEYRVIDLTWKFGNLATGIPPGGQED